NVIRQHAEVDDAHAKPICTARQRDSKSSKATFLAKGRDVFLRAKGDMQRIRGLDLRTRHAWNPRTALLSLLLGKPRPPAASLSRTCKRKRRLSHARIICTNF